MRNAMSFSMKNGAGSDEELSAGIGGYTTVQL